MKKSILITAATTALLAMSADAQSWLSPEVDR